MTTETLYRKFGRRYQPVGEWETMSRGDVWPKGAHLTLCDPGSQFTRFDVQPDKAALLTAFYQHREAAMQAIQQSSAWHLQRGEWETKRVKVARDVFLASVGKGEGLLTFSGPSAAGIFDAIVRIVEAKP